MAQMKGCGWSLLRNDASDRKETDAKHLCSMKLGVKYIYEYEGEEV